ncbi:MAG TPA: glycosyltransferase family 39 protein [Candidatus Acidoferrum sp.]
MRQTNSSSIDGPTPFGGISLTTARLLWILLILATLYLCYFHKLGAIGLVGPDEPRYAWIARDMAESGDLVTPRLYGQPWFEKPVLYYWAAAKTFKLFGVSEASARFPSAFCALLATLSMAWLSWKLYGTETARWLLLLLPTTVGMIGFSHAAATDMLFSGTLTIAMVFAAVVVGLTWNSDSPILPRTPWLALLFLGFSLGLAVLAKGPAALILSGSAIFLWAAFARRWRDAFRCLHPLAIVSFCATALPWYILCTRRNPDFFHVFIIEHNFKRFLTPEFQHIQPFWYYIPVILLTTFPWTILLVCGVTRATRISRRTFSNHPALLFFLTWALFTILFFSISKSKLPGYILPALPAIVILISRYAVHLLRENKHSTRWISLLTGVAFLLLGFGLQHYARKLPAMQCVTPLCGITRIWLIAAIGGVVIGGLGCIRKFQLSLLAVVLTALSLVIEIDRFLPNLDPGVSTRDTTLAVKNIWPDFSPQHAAAWQLNRSYVYQLSFYLHKEIPEWQSNQQKPDWLFVKKEKRQEAIQQGFKCATYAIYLAVIPCRNVESLNRLSVGNSGGVH